MSHLDRYSRPLRNLRISVTDRCNLRCQYCMPEEDYVWLPRDDLLRFEEISRLVDAFCALGVDRVRLTGGEPLLRRGLHTLVGMLADKPAVRDIAMTTNAVLLVDTAQELRSAGLHRVTVSLDTLKADRFQALTRRDDLDRTLRGIEAALAAGFERPKINVVVMNDFNDDELVDLMEYAKQVGGEIRYIEYMDVGGATQWSMNRVLPAKAILARLEDHYGEVKALPRTDSAPANRYELPDGTRFGLIASTTTPFCSSCDRSRLTADGKWFTCLYACAGTDLRAPLRTGATDETLRQIIVTRWTDRDDRGAEIRLAEKQRTPLANANDLRDNPHLEMHTRGG